jgi:Chromate transporter
MQRTLTEKTVSQPSTHRVPDQAPPGPSRPSSWELLLAFLRLGTVSFGGSAMVAYIKRLAVTRKGWLSEDDFQQGVALCQAVPGATAMQCAAYVGLRVRGLRGAVLAYAEWALQGLPAAHGEWVHDLHRLGFGLRPRHHHAVVVRGEVNQLWSSQAESHLFGPGSALLGPRTNGHAGAARVFPIPAGPVSQIP